MHAFRANNDMELEDFFFHLDTPGTLDREVLILDSAWQTLKRRNMDSEFIQSEVTAWEIFAKDVLDSSWLYKTLPVGIGEDLDNWKRRYKDAYAAAPNKTDVVKPPLLPESILNNPLVWVVVGLAIGVGIYIYAKQK